MSRKKQNGLLILLCLVLTLLMALLCGNLSLWRDEAFSLNLIRMSFSDLITATAQDVHPPLYYLMLKVFVDGVHWFFPAAETIVLAKIFSVIPIGIVLIIGSLFLCEKKSFRAALIFIVLMFGTQILPYAIEIRMYSWALLFVTLSWLFMPGPGQSKPIRWVLFVGFSVAAAYTHYYAAVAVSLFYFACLGQCWKRKQLKPWLLSFSATVLLYLPWFCIALGQIAQRSQNYWIDDISFGALVSYVNFPFSTGFPVLTLALFIFVFFFLLLYWKKAEKKERKIILGILTPVYAGGVGILVSLCIRPFFVARYLVPSLGCFWLAFSVVVDHCLSGKKAVRFTTAFLLLVNGMTYVHWWQIEQERKEGLEEFQQYVTSTSKTLVVLDEELDLVLDILDLPVQQAPVLNRELQQLDQKTIVLDYAGDRIDQLQNRQSLRLEFLLENATVVALEQKGE